MGLLLAEGSGCYTNFTLEVGVKCTDIMGLFRRGGVLAYTKKFENLEGLKIAV